MLSGGACEKDALGCFEGKEKCWTFDGDVYLLAWLDREPLHNKLIYRGRVGDVRSAWRAVINEGFAAFVSEHANERVNVFEFGC